MINKMLDKIDWSERELRRSERLAAIGELALMIGHDLGSPLQTIVVTIYLAKAKIDNLSIQEQGILKDQGFLEDLETIDNQLNYMDKIVSDLHDYARSLSPKIVDIDLIPFVKNVLAGMIIPRNVEVKMEIDDGLTWEIDPTMMKRVLTNLVTNAVQAMPDGGKLIISGTSSEENAILNIKDTGAGIPPELIPKIFDPLFTTKSKSMGMGLVVAKRLVEAQCGRLNINSVTGKGTVVVVQIPIRKNLNG